MINEIFMTYSVLLLLTTRCLIKKTFYFFRNSLKG